MILGHQILMILSDFGGPGIHFLMIFEARGLILETWRPILTISWIFSDFDDISARKGQSFLASFWIQILLFFLSVHFSSFFVIWGARRLQNGRHLEVTLRTFLVIGYFLIFATPILRYLDF